MQPPATYRTLAGPATAEYKEKGSKFLAFVYPVTSDKDVQTHLGALRAEYHDARHHCYAFILGHEGEKFRANDDGEPGHSAGDPILGQLRSHSLTGVLAVVVRYFGGTKLGVSGLINAYKTATAEALEDARIVTREITDKVMLEYAYDSTNELMRLVEEFRLQVGEQEFTDRCRMVAKVNVNWTAALKEKVELLNATGSEISLRTIRDSPSF